MALLGACGEDEDSGPPVNRLRMERLEVIEEQVARRELPPITLRLFGLDGHITFNSIGDPNATDDYVLRTRAHGTRGPKLKWDLDQDGKIDADEREITKRELYDATLPALDEAARRLRRGPEGSEKS